jgi:WD40 repeat protein
MDKVFHNDFLDEESLREKEKRKFDYTLYIAEKTPWFIGNIVQCIVDLPNINFLATGSYDKLIRLWDLRGGIPISETLNIDFDERTSAKNTRTSNATKDMKRSSAGVAAKKMASSKFRQSRFGVERDDLYDDFAKEPTKILDGHTKAVREIAYSERHKILVSCGFDF